MSNARQLAANLPREGGLSNRNLIINGAMQVWQRSVSVTGKTVGGYFTADRWQGWASGSTFNQSRQEVALGDSIVGAFKYFLRHEVTTANDFAGLIYKIEDVQSVPEGTITLSFYAKGTNPGGGQLQVRVRQNFGTGGIPSSEVIEAAQGLVLTSSWQRFVYQFDVPSLSGKTIGTDANSSYYRLDIQQPGVDDTTSAWTLDLTGVQLEVGDTATPFEHRSYSDQLLACQRFYYKVNSADANGSYYRLCNAMCTSAVSAAGHIRHPVEMRTTPTFSASASGTWALWDGTSVWGVTGVSVGSDSESKQSSMIAIDGVSGLTAYRPVMIIANANKTAYVSYDAEL